MVSILLFISSFSGVYGDSQVFLLSWDNGDVQKMVYKNLNYKNIFPKKHEKGLKHGSPSLITSMENIGVLYYNSWISIRFRGVCEDGFMDC